MSVKPARLLRHLLVVAITTMAAPFVHAADPVTLKVFNWPDYLGDSVIRQFSEKHNVRVEVVPYESDELKDDLLLRTNGGEGMDIIVSARHSMARLINQKWLLPLDNSKLPGRKNMPPRFDAPRNKVSGYALPYLWGTMGIAWRKDKVPEGISSWKDFFNPGPALQGRIMMVNDSQDAIGMSLKAAGYSANDTSAEALAKAGELLRGQKPHVARYAYPALDETSELLGDNIRAAMLYNGDALTLKALNPNIEYRVPREGGNIWVDYIAILAASKHPAEAHAFLEFLCDPKVAADNALELNFAPANTASERLLPLDFLSNPAVYPPRNTLGRSEQYTDLTPEQQKQRTDLFLEVSQ